MNETSTLRKNPPPVEKFNISLERRMANNGGDDTERNASTVKNPWVSRAKERRGKHPREKSEKRGSNFFRRKKSEREREDPASASSVLGTTHNVEKRRGRRVGRRESIAFSTHSDRYRGFRCFRAQISIYIRAYVCTHVHTCTGRAHDRYFSLSWKPRVASRYIFGINARPAVHDLARPC